MYKKLVVFLLLFPAFIFGADENLSIKTGSSKIVKIDDASDVTVSKKSIVSAAIISDKEILVEGKKAGIAVIEIKTSTGVKNVVVEVKSPRLSEKMIEIDVQVLEIVTSDGLDVGVDWPTLLGPAQIKADDSGGPVAPLNIKEENLPPLLAFGKFSRGPINVMIDMLVKKNSAKILAKPKLLASNGKKAEFLSGGEIPVAITNMNGQVSVDWKKYGVMLEIKPEITTAGTIDAYLSAEVSNLDYANAVKVGVNGGVLPALKTRQAQTNINVDADETIIIAGMIENEEIKITNGVPVLSGIPLLGELFKQTITQNQKTELVIFVTPKIVGNDAI